MINKCMIFTSHESAISSHQLEQMAVSGSSISEIYSIPQSSMRLIAEDLFWNWPGIGNNPTQLYSPVSKWKQTTWLWSIQGTFFSIQKASDSSDEIEQSQGLRECSSMGASISGAHVYCGRRLQGLYLGFDCRSGSIWVSNSIVVIQGRWSDIESFLVEFTKGVVGDQLRQPIADFTSLRKDSHHLFLKILNIVKALINW